MPVPRVRFRAELKEGVAMEITGDLVKHVPRLLQSQIVAYLDYVIGGLFVLMYASHRFNTPTTNRSTTTWLRYHMAAKSYWLVGLALFILLAIHQPFQAILKHSVSLLGLDPQASELAGRLSPPLLAALFLTVLLPRVPYLADVDEWIRRWLQKVAAIPFEARRVSAELRKGTFTVPPAMRDRVTADLLSEEFRKEDLLFTESRAPQFLWTKITVLMRHLDSLEADHGFAAFMAAYPTELAQVRAQYKLLLPKARKCFRLTRDLPADLDGRRSRASDAVREYRDEFGDQARALLGTIYDFLSRGVLQSRHSYAARCELLRELGFDCRLAEPALTLNQHVMLFLLLITLLAVGFVVAEPSNRTDVGEVLFRSLRIAVLYTVAVLCAVYRPRRLKLAQRDERGFPPVTWYLLVGGMAAVIALIANAALKTLGDVDLATLNFAEVLKQVLVEVREKYPWLLMTFVTGAAVACLVDIKPGVALTPTRLRWIDGTVMAALAMTAAVIVWFWLEQTGGRSPHMQLRWLLFRSALMSFTIGALVPTWSRQARRKAQPTVSQDVALVSRPGGLRPVTRRLPPMGGPALRRRAIRGRATQRVNGTSRGQKLVRGATTKRTAVAAGLAALLLPYGIALFV